MAGFQRVHLKTYVYDGCINEWQRWLWLVELVIVLGSKCRDIPSRVCNSVEMAASTR